MESNFNSEMQIKAKEVVWCFQNSSETRKLSINGKGKAECKHVWEKIPTDLIKNLDCQNNKGQVIIIPPHCFQHKHHVMLSNPERRNGPGIKASTVLTSSCIGDGHSQLLWHQFKDSRWESLSCHTSAHGWERKGAAPTRLNPETE